MRRGGSTAKDQEDFTEEVTEVGFKGCLGVSQGGQGLDGGGKGLGVGEPAADSKDKSFPSKAS